MPLSDLYSNINFLFRWLHVITGIIWLGHLYFFNFVTIPLRRAFDETERKTAYPKLMLRSLWWSRWGAMIAFLTGPVLFVMNYLYVPGVGFGPTALFIDNQGITARAAWVMFGMVLAAVMWFNVWFIVWPAFKREMSGGVLSAEHLQVLRRRSFRASRTNAFLSGPMLFGMLAPAHYGAINLEVWLIALAIGILVIWGAIKLSSSVGTSV